jgi:hypothetical protein
MIYIIPLYDHDDLMVSIGYSLFSPQSLPLSVAQHKGMEFKCAYPEFNQLRLSTGYLGSDFSDGLCVLWPMVTHNGFSSQISRTSSETFTIN